MRSRNSTVVLLALASVIALMTAVGSAAQKRQQCHPRAGGAR